MAEGGCAGKRPEARDRGGDAARRGDFTAACQHSTLHYVYDLWVEQWRRRANGDVIVVRYADDTIVGFQHPKDAERFLIELKARLAQFALTLHPEKTRLIEFGRFAAGTDFGVV